MAQIQIITTDESGGGFACEALWYKMAESALDANYSIEVHVAGRSVHHPRVVALRENGALVRTRWSEPKSQKVGQVLHKLWQRFGAKWKRRRDLSKGADFLILNVGTMVEIAREPWFSVLSLSNAPYGILIHNNPEIRQYSEMLQFRMRKVLTKASRVWFVSRRLWINAEEQLLVKIPGARVVRNPVNLISTNMEPWPAQLTPLRLAMVGRLDAYVKGQIRLIHALSGNQWRNRDWQLSIFGAGSDEIRIRDAAKFYGIEYRVLWGGFATDIRKEIWATHHVLVMPSMLEGMPLTLVEAMICGRPAVCSDVGGASELVKDGVNGFLSESPFVCQLADTLERLWVQRDKLETMGRQAHHRAMEFLPASPGRDLLKDVQMAVSSSRDPNLH